MPPASVSPIEELLRVAPLARLSLDQYHGMIAAGVLGEDDRVELLEGVLVDMSPQSAGHAFVIQTLNLALARALPRGFVVRPQLPLTLASGESEPEPDLAVVRATDATSSERHPATALLVVEVAAESLAKDQTVKARLYARAGIPEYWIVDVAARAVEVRRDPDAEAGTWGSVARLTAPAELTSALLPGFRIAVGELF